MRTYTLLTSVVISAGMAACTGSIGGDDAIGGPGSGPGAGAGSTSPSAVPPGQLDPAVECTGDPTPGAAPLRRLTQEQYNNVVRDLLGDTTRPADKFPADETLGIFSNNAAAMTVSPLLAQSYFTASEELALNALKNKQALLGCAPANATEEDACARSFVEAFGAKAFRRPLAAAEVDEIVKVYTDNKTGGTFDIGIEAALEAMLNSAQFLYIEEYGALAQSKAGVVPVGPYEMASRLSFFLWNTLPDQALFEAAAKNELSTADQVRAQAQRMIKDPKAADATREFHDQWLQLKRLSGVTKDPTTYPDFSDELRVSMLSETRAFVDYAFWRSDGKVETLLTAPVSFLDVNTAKIYGVAPPSTPMQMMQLDPSQRAGILTQLAVLATQAKPNQSSPILRGKFVRERLLCTEMPPPPADLVITSPVVAPGATTRERFAEHTKNPACQGCHELMDPIGFGFEHYDGTGKWRDQDQGLPVDSSGQLAGTDVDSTFNGVPDLAKRLASSQKVKNCVSTEWYRYSLGRADTQGDRCSLAVAQKSFSDSKFDLRELLVGITTTDAFRYRPEVKP